MVKTEKHILQARYFRNKFLDSIREIDLHYRRANKFPKEIREEIFDYLENQLLQLEERYSFPSYISYNLEKYNTLDGDLEVISTENKQLVSFARG